MELLYFNSSSSSTAECPAQSYFDGSDFMTLASHILAVITLPINFYGLFLIHYKSSPTMRNMKNTMLLLHVWSTISDVMIGTMTIPYIFFPIIVGIPLGLLSKLGIHALLQTYITVSIIAEVGACIVFLFENRQRHMALFKSRLKMSSLPARIIFSTVNVIIPFLFSIPAFLDIPEQGEAKIQLLKKVPCPTIEYFTHPTAILKDPVLVGSLLGFMMAFLFIQCIFFIAHATYSLQINMAMTTLSEKTKQLQRKYLISAGIQILIPFIALYIPVGYFVFSIVNTYYNQALNNICFLMASIHGFISTTSTILIYDPYKNYTISIFRGKRAEENRKMNKAKVESTTIIGL